MIRAVQANEGLRMPGSLEDGPGTARFHHLVLRRVDDQQRPAQGSNALAQCVRAEPAQIVQLSGIGSGSEGHHGSRLGYLGRDGQHRTPAERMADEDARRSHNGTELVGGNS
jgi:hypothetical protein